MLQDTLEDDDILRLGLVGKVLCVALDDGAFVSEVFAGRLDRPVNRLDADDLVAHFAQDSHRLRLRATAHHQKPSVLTDVDQPVEVSQDRFDSRRLVRPGRDYCLIRIQREVAKARIAFEHSSIAIEGL
jgi:hypothetical protein